MQDRAPHLYRTSLQATDLVDAVVEAKGHTPLIGGPPSQFGGSDSWWSPEDLLVSATNLCFYTTYRAMARRQGFTVAGYRSDAEGSLVKTPGGFVFERIRLTVSIEVAAVDVARARALVDEVKRWCMVSNMLRCPVEVSAEVAGELQAEVA